MDPVNGAGAGPDAEPAAPAVPGPDPAPDTTLPPASAAGSANTVQGPADSAPTAQLADAAPPPPDRLPLSPDAGSSAPLPPGPAPTVQLPAIAPAPIDPSTVRYTAPAPPPGAPSAPPVYQPPAPAYQPPPPPVYQPPPAPPMAIGPGPGGYYPPPAAPPVYVPPGYAPGPGPGGPGPGGAPPPYAPPPMYGPPTQSLPTAPLAPPGAVTPMPPPYAGPLAPAIPAEPQRRLVVTSVLLGMLGALAVLAGFFAPWITVAAEAGEQQFRFDVSGLFLVFGSLADQQYQWMCAVPCLGAVLAFVSVVALISLGNGRAGRVLMRFAILLIVLAAPLVIPLQLGNNAYQQIVATVRSEVRQAEADNTDVMPALLTILPLTTDNLDEALLREELVIKLHNPEDLITRGWGFYLTLVGFLLCLGNGVLMLILSQSRRRAAARAG